MFNLMGRFSHIQMLRVGEVEFVDGGHLTVKNSYMVGNPDGLVFCVGFVKKYLANCKQQKRKWARAGFVKFFASPVVRCE